MSAVNDGAVDLAQSYFRRGIDALGYAKRPARGPAPWLDRLRNAAAGTLRQEMGDPDLREIARVEREIKYPGSQHSFMVRPEELGIQSRADISGSLSAGGYLIDAPNLGYAPYPQPATMAVDLVEQMVLPFGSGNISVPTGASSMTPTYQGAENQTISDSTLTTGQRAASPHTAICTVTFSRLLGLQSTPSVNAVLELELKNSLRAAVSAAILNGSGVSGQPHGIVGATNVGTESGATIALANIITSQQTVADANGIFDPTRVAYFGAPDTAAVMMARFPSPMVVPLWDGNINSGRVRGIQAFGTKSMPASTLLYGDFSTVLLVIWGGIEILVDPFQGAGGTGSNSNFQQGLISVRLALSFDVVLRYPISFYALTSVS